MRTGLTFRRLLLLPGLLCVASLTYCGIHSDPPASSQAVHPPGFTKMESDPQHSVAFNAADGSQVNLRGYTSIGPWSSCSCCPNAQVILFTKDEALWTLLDKIGSGEVSGDPLSLPMTRPPIAQLAVPVDSLRGSSDGMDRDMRTALKASEHPFIEYDLLEVRGVDIQRDPNTSQADLVLHVAGNLNVAGVQRTVSTDVTIQRKPCQCFVAGARIDMRMSDFGVTPPTALFGLIRAHDAVSVLFNLQFAPAATQTSQPAAPKN